MSTTDHAQAMMDLPAGDPELTGKGGNEYLSARIIAEYHRDGDFLEVRAWVEPNDANTTITTLQVGLRTPVGGGTQGSYCLTGTNGPVPSQMWWGKFMLGGASSQLNRESYAFVSGSVVTPTPPITGYYFTQPITTV